MALYSKTFVECVNRNWSSSNKVSEPVIFTRRSSLTEFSIEIGPSAVKSGVLWEKQLGLRNT